MTRKLIILENDDDWEAVYILDDDQWTLAQENHTLPASDLLELAGVEVEYLYCDFDEFGSRGQEELGYELLKRLRQETEEWNTPS